MKGEKTKTLTLVFVAGDAPTVKTIRVPESKVGELVNSLFRGMKDAIKVSPVETETCEAYLLGGGAALFASVQCPRAHAAVMLKEFEAADEATK